MCSRKRHELAAAKGIWEKTYGRPLSEMPPRGCTENLGGVLAPYGIAVEDVPSPFNIFQHMIIHADTGELEHSHIRPKPPGAYCDAARRDGAAGGDQHLPRHGGRRHDGRDAGAVRRVTKAVIASVPQTEPPP